MYLKRYEFYYRSSFFFHNDIRYAFQCSLRIIKYIAGKTRQASEEYRVSYREELLRLIIVIAECFSF